MRDIGNFCDKHKKSTVGAKASAKSDEVTSTQGCIGCLAFIGIALIATLLWTAGGAVLGWVTGGDDSDSKTRSTQTALSSCENAFGAAAAVSNMQDTVDDLFPAVRACATVAEWTAASRRFPAALDGADPVTFLRNVCRYSAPSAVAQSKLCTSVG